MISRKLFCLAALSLAACSSSEPATDAGQSKQAAPMLQEASNGATPVSASAMDRALAATMKALHATVRYDHVKADAKGRERRQVFLEVVQSTAEQDVAAVTQALEKAGFQIKAGKVNDKGRRLLAHIKGAHSIAVLIRDKSQGLKLRNPEALSSVSFREWVTAAPKPATNAPTRKVGG